MNKNVVSIAVAAALNQPRIAETTVTITVKARASVDVPIAPLVAEALLEFVQACPATAQGKFETKAGLDVAWDVQTKGVN